MIKSIPEFLKQSKQSQDYFCNNGLYIITDKSQLIPLKLNKIQKKLDDIANEEKAKKGYIRVIVLKARRHGLSTYIASRGFAHILLTQYTTSAIIAHENMATNRIFRMIKAFYDFLPFPKGYDEKGNEIDQRPKLKRSNRKELEFEDIHSYMEVFTAGEKHSARSGGYTFVHGSEVAFYPSPEQLINIVQGVKQEPGTEIWYESTANGHGGFFHSKWMSASNYSSIEQMEKSYEIMQSQEDYRAVFFAWFDHEDYKLNFRSQRQRENFIESVENHKYVEKYGEELEEKNLYGLSWEQLNWRRYYIDNNCQGHPTLQPLDYFKQEMPANPIEAFISTGGCVFKTLILLHNQKLSTHPIARGAFRWKNIEQKEIDWYDDPGGEIKIWQLPDTEPLENRYAGGCDPSGGVLESDFTACSVMDRLNNTNKVVATWHGYADSDKMAEQLYMLALFYNKDISWCIEKNAYGDPIITQLLKKWNYNKLYLFRKLDRRKEKLTPDVIGFKTTKASKPILIQTLNAWIRDGVLIDYDEDFWKECLTFVYGKRLLNSTYYEMSALNKGKQGSADRNYDDRVFARALMIEMHRVMSPVKHSFANLPKWMKEERIKAQQPKSWQTS